MFNKFKWDRWLINPLGYQLLLFPKIIQRVNHWPLLNKFTSFDVTNWWVFHLEMVCLSYTPLEIERRGVDGRNSVRSRNIILILLPLVAFMLASTTRSHLDSVWYDSLSIICPPLKLKGEGWVVEILFGGEILSSSCHTDADIRVCVEILTTHCRRVLYLVCADTEDTIGSGHGSAHTRTDYSRGLSPEVAGVCRQLWVIFSTWMVVLRYGESLIFPISRQNELTPPYTTINRTPWKGGGRWCTWLT